MEEVGIDSVAAGYLVPYGGSTLVEYRRVVTQWLSWCSEQSIDPMAPTTAQVESWGRWLSEMRGMARSSVRRSLSVVCGLYRHATATGAIPADPCAGVRLPRVPGHSEGTCLDRGQAALALSIADGMGPDDRALVLLMLLSGLRVSEALGLDVGDWDAPALRVASRKGGWSQLLAVPERTARTLDTLCSKRSAGALLRRSGRRMTRAQAASLVCGLGERVGAEGITPHSLRRTFATLARDAGVEDSEIMATGGWSSVRMINYYDMGRRGMRSGAGDALDAYLTAALARG
jgi:integrase